MISSTLGGTEDEGSRRLLGVLAMNGASHDYGMANGHSPMAAKTVAVDYDGTLYPFGELFSRAKPNPGAVAAVRRMKEAGFKIIIFTSRLSPTWCFSEHESMTGQYNYIQDMLLRDDIPFDEITSEKLPCIAYIDDRAITYHGHGEDEWTSIANSVIQKYGGDA